MEHHDGSRGRRPGGNRDEVSRSAWVRKKGRNARVKLGRLRDHCLAYVNGRLIGPRARRELPVPVTMVGVWRTKNLEVVRALVAQLPEGSQVHLHCLDEAGTLGELAGHTRDRGPGARMKLLQRLLDDNPQEADRWILIVDDDISFPLAGVDAFIALAVAAGLDLAQPAHLPTSASTFQVTAVRLGSLVRLTRFVEVGPVVLVSPRVRGAVLPFPVDVEMGWGLDVEWTQLVDQGFRLGVVDAAPLVHQGPAGTSYSRPREFAVLKDRLARVGANSSHELARDTGQIWRPWQPRPRWRVS